MIFIFIILFIFVSIYIMISFDKKYINDLEKLILKNTSIEDITYINKYDDNYIVSDKEYMYLFNSSYDEIYKVKLSIIHENENNYDLIYKDNTLMYMDDYRNKEGLIFKYYDIYTYKLIDEIVVGGN